MKGRSPLVVAGAAIGGCLVLLVCAALWALAGYVVLSQGNLLDAIVPTVTNRIVYVGADSNIYVVDPSGKNKAQLTRDGDGGTAHRYDFPTWAFDGRHIAFVGINYSGQNPTDGSLYAVEPGGQNLRTLYKSDQFIPFYLYWSPDSHYIGFLTSKNSNSLALRIASSDKENSTQEVDSGSPLYWAWSPDSKNVLLHIGGTKTDSDTAHLAVLDLTSKKSAQAFPSSPGTFEAPQWSPDGQHVLFSQMDSAQKQSVTVANVQGQQIKNLFDYDGRVSFSWSPTGDRIAYIVTPPDVRLPTFGTVRVVDGNGQNGQDISDDHALAFLWSPNGRRLAYLTVQVNGSSGNRFKGLAQAGGGNAIAMQWHVKDFDTGKTEVLASFAPTDDFLNTLGFFDQYSRSITYWSPDSQKFVYTNADSASTNSIWVAQVSGTGNPVKIGEGSIAFWSWR